MKKEQFFELKDKIQKDLDRKLQLSKDPRLGDYPVAFKEVSKKFRLQYDMDNQLQLLKEITAFADEVNGVITHTSHDDGRGRVGYYDHTTFYVEYLEVVDEITKAKLKDTVHKALCGIMGLSEYAHIDCKLMQLYKDGKLSWEDLIKAHKEDCTL
jgi:hypothetical protein